MKSEKKWDVATVGIVAVLVSLAFLYPPINNDSNDGEPAPVLAQSTRRKSIEMNNPDTRIQTSTRILEEDESEGASTTSFDDAITKIKTLVQENEIERAKVLSDESLTSGQQIMISIPAPSIEESNLWEELADELIDEMSKKDREKFHEAWESVKNSTASYKDAYKLVIFNIPTNSEKAVSTIVIDSPKEPVQGDGGAITTESSGTLRNQSYGEHSEWTYSHLLSKAE